MVMVRGRVSRAAARPREDAAPRVRVRVRVRVSVRVRVGLG